MDFFKLALKLAKNDVARVAIVMVAVLMFMVSIFGKNGGINLNFNINSNNNNKNSISGIVVESLGKEVQEKTLKQMVYGVKKYYSGADEKLEKLLNNKAFVENLMLQINEAHRSKRSIEELLFKSEKERKEALKELDELKKELANSSNIDFKKVLEDAEKALGKYDSKQYREILKSYEEDRKNKEIVKNIATAHYLRAKSFASDFMQEEAEKEIEKAVALNENNADYLGSYGVILFNQAKYKKALKYLTKSLEIRQQIGDKAGEGTTLNNISQIYDAQGDYPTALKYLTKSLEIQQQIGDKAGEGTTLNNIATAHHANGDYPTALKYLTKSLEIRQQIGDKAGMCATLFNLGHIFLKNNERDKAMTYWKQAYTIATKINEARVLDALTKLAEQLGLESGLKGWERRD